MTSGCCDGGDPAGDALAERDPRPADLVAVEAVRGGEGQVRSIPIQQVEGGDVRVERVAGPVDDRLEELVPGPRRRRETQDLVEEPELLELVRRRRAASACRPRWRERERTDAERALGIAITLQA